MCVGPYINGATATQPKPAAQQTSDGIAQASPAVWRLLADKGGVMGEVARAKLNEIQPATPVISKTK